WLFSQNTLQKHIDEGRICFKKEHKDDERGFIYKRYLKDLKTDLTTFDSLKFVDNKFMNQSATKGLKELNMVEAFSYPKSVEFIQEIINHATNDNHDIILDFFAGSGTTAHAVMAQNAQDNGNRKFILVQLDEKIDEKKSKTAFDFCKNELGSKEPVISDITIERVKRAKKALNSQMEFSVYEIDDEPEIDLEKGVIRNNISAIDLVTNMLLKSGNEIGGKEIICVIENKLYKVNNDYFVINLDNKGEIFENDDVKQIFGILNQDRNGNVFADMYMDCHIQNWLNFREKFKERLRII
ncbi:MAG: site-specific DNA-methyltransferase, partial [Campylobacter sp.]